MHKAAQKTSLELIAGLNPDIFQTIILNKKGK